MNLLYSNNATHKKCKLLNVRFIVLTLYSLEKIKKSDFPVFILQFRRTEFTQGRRDEHKFQAYTGPPQEDSAKLIITDPIYQQYRTQRYVYQCESKLVGNMSGINPGEKPVILMLNVSRDFMFRLGLFQKLFPCILT